jgi:hypothetical protein
MKLMKILLSAEVCQHFMGKLTSVFADQSFELLSAET